MIIIWCSLWCQRKYHYIDTLTQSWKDLYLYWSSLKMPGKPYTVRPRKPKKRWFLFWKMLLIFKISEYTSYTGWSCDDPCEQCWDSLRKHPPRHSWLKVSLSLFVVVFVFSLLIQSESLSLCWQLQLNFTHLRWKSVEKSLFFNFPILCILPYLYVYFPIVQWPR